MAKFKYDEDRGDKSSDLLSRAQKAADEFIINGNAQKNTDRLIAHYGGLMNEPAGPVVNAEPPSAQNADEPELETSPAPQAPGPSAPQYRTGTKTTYTAHNYLGDIGDYTAPERLPAYQGKYDDQIQQILGDILGRGEFKYDFNADPLYHQYAENYTNKGKLAMMDTLGQAAALTGGYGNTYANQVAQQTYNGYMQDLSNQIPNLYQLAENTWLNNLNAKRADLSTLEGLDSSDYGKYRDTVGDWENDRDFGYQKYLNDISRLKTLQDYYQAHPELDPLGTKTTSTYRYAVNPQAGDQSSAEQLAADAASAQSGPNDDIYSWAIDYASSHPGQTVGSATVSDAIRNAGFSGSEKASTAMKALAEAGMELDPRLKASLMK